MVLFSGMYFLVRALFYIFCSGSSLFWVKAQRNAALAQRTNWRVRLFLPTRNTRAIALPYKKMEKK
jgi:hypothetical protein